MIKNIAKKILIGNIILTLGGCYTSNQGYRNTNCYHDNSQISKSKEQKAISFKNNMLENTLYVLSPHNDDAVLSDGGIISEFNGTKYIVTFFSTPLKTPYDLLTKWDKLSGFTKSIDTRVIRKIENDNAANVVGAKVINLDYVDKQYEQRSEEDNFNIINSIAKDIEEIIESNGSDQVTIIGPAYFGKKLHILITF